MKMTKNWKRFWTLDRHHAEGFTLVELIVVIAILAILAGVAVPAYSGYITEANKTADRQLVRDVEQALMMGYYQGLIDQNGKVVLSTSGVTCENLVPIAAEGENLKGPGAALQDAFGADYAEKLVLKHDSWNINGAILGLTDAKAVYNSSYYQSADKLMAQVEEITGAAWNLVTGNSGEANRDQMIAMFEGDLLNEVAGQYGYNSITDVPNEALPNLLVLAVATDVATGANNEDYQTSQASGLIEDFALYNGYASTAEGKASGFDKEYQKFVDAINNASGVSEVAEAYRTLSNATANNAGWAAYTSGEQSKTDSAAFAAMMGGMAGSAMTHGDGIKNGLSQNNFFTAGLGNELFCDYMDAVGAMAGLDSVQSTDIVEEALEGNVVIFFSVDQGKIIIGNTLPTN